MNFFNFGLAGTKNKASKITQVQHHLYQKTRYNSVVFLLASKMYLKTDLLEQKNFCNLKMFKI